MAKAKKSTSAERTSLQNRIKAEGFTLPHGYELKVIKKRKSAKKTAKPKKAAAKKTARKRK